ncbi:IMP cyclohydrolase [Haloterrigena sp. SYSU A558-1]|uniref:IMP cyclohydrolase n=1 Tax=Haloterrigena gelatinilytica TaxID=2741724 RepID=A0A8J8GKK5_9EURY|nr:IMP cyclohydrolase [Haloterrigena gelatinilytica]NUB90069.1 IMP cyclohydrolase [Haloterrigena gelatinilytica]NUC74106.1 IMP cyclohydrolase [Haloterrigena gelatinilytica]
MYVGRFVVVGPEGGAYRVSSRSFPNRELTERDEALTVGPTEDAPETDNPYVSYNCLRVVETPTGETAAFGNGSHVDPIAEKLELGYPARDALAESLLALDYEKDDYDTPRIAATIGADGEALIGTVRKDALLVETVDEPTLVATYEKNAPEPIDFEAESADAAASEAYDLEFEHAVCAAGVVRTDDGFETAIENSD